MSGNNKYLIIFSCILMIILILYLRCKKENTISHYNPKGFLIFKASGGLIHMLLLLDSCIYLCHKENRKLIVDTHNHSAFRMDFNDFFYIKNLEYYTNYDKLSDDIYVGNVPINVIKTQGIHMKTKGKYYIKYNNNSYLVNSLSSKNKDIIVKSSYKTNNNPLLKGIYVKKDILNILKQKEIKEKYIGVHYRNTDIQTNIKNVFKNIKSKFRKQNDISIIFLATDDYSSVKLFKDEFKDKKIVNFSSIKEKSIKNLHYLSDDILKKILKTD